MISKERLAGFGFIEILVSLLVVAMGTVGMALLHTRSLQYNQVTYYHSQSIVLIMDMLERLRVNKSLALTTSAYQAGSDDAAPISCANAFYPDNCEVGQCSPEQLARYDIQQWQFQLSCQLPEATGTISYEEESAGRIYTIAISFERSPARLKPADLMLRSSL